MGNWLGDVYRDRIVDPGREPLFLLLLGLIGSFLFIRFSVRMIRREVSWWPGNVSSGGTHIHHVVFGLAFLLIGGIGAFAVRGDGRVTYDVLAVLFGIGCGLVLDEFALVLHLEDVYWKEEGRQSVNAVILAVSVIGLLLVGQAPLGGYVGGTHYVSYLTAAVTVVFVVVCLAKGKVWTGLLGVFVPVLAVVGALRLARPNSPWARWRYRSRPRRMARAERREYRIHRRVDIAKTAVMDAVAGAPSETAEAPTAAQARPTIVDLPPSRLELLLARVLPPLRDPGAVVAVWYLRLATAVNVVTGAVTPFRHGVTAASNGEYITAFLVSPGFTGAAVAFVLSVSLRRRKRAAWIVTAVLVGAYALATGITLASLHRARVHPFNWVSFGLTLLLLLALLVSRPRFNVRGERGNAVLALLTALIGAAVAVGVGMLLVHATDQDPPRGWGTSAQYAAVRVLTVSGVFNLPGVRVPGWTDLTINLLSAALLVVVLLAFLRAPHARERLSADDERRLRALLRAPSGAGGASGFGVPADGPGTAGTTGAAGAAAGAGAVPGAVEVPGPSGGSGASLWPGDRGPSGSGDSFGYFALRRDHSVCWSPDGRAAIAYRVVNGVALASADPLGSRHAWTAAIAGWLDLTRRHAWVAAVVSAGPAGWAAYEAAGFRAIASGEETVVEAVEFAAALRTAPAGPRTGAAPPVALPPPAGSPRPLSSPPGGGAGKAGSSPDDGAFLVPGAAAGDAPAGAGSAAREGADEARTGADVAPVGGTAPARGTERHPDASPADLAGVRRVMRTAGYRVEVRRAKDVAAGDWGRLRSLAAAWRRSRGGVELGRIGDGGDGECVVAECLDPRGRACAVLMFVPWGTDGLTLDLVRWDRESGQGPVDFLLTEVLLRAATGSAPLAGVARVSFNLLRRPFAAYGPHPRERRLLFEHRTELPRVVAAGLAADGLREGLRARRWLVR